MLRYTLLVLLYVTCGIALESSTDTAVNLLSGELRK